MVTRWAVVAIFCISSQIASHFWLCVGIQDFTCRHRCLSPMWKSSDNQGIWFYPVFSLIVNHYGSTHQSLCPSPRMFCWLRVRWFLEKFVESLSFSVLGCSDPSPVRSVAFCMLAPASCRARDHALLRCAARIHFRTIVVFQCVSLLGRNQSSKVCTSFTRQAETCWTFSWHLVLDSRHKLHTLTTLYTVNKYFWKNKSRGL